MSIPIVNHTIAGRNTKIYPLSNTVTFTRYPLAMDFYLCGLHPAQVEPIVLELQAWSELGQTIDSRKIA